MIKAAIFDFDGTIANTLFDLQDSINEALKMNGFSREYTFEETKYLVGSGIRILCTRALSYKEHTLEQEEQVFSDFKKCYEKNQFNKTKPYPHVVETLLKLKEKGIKLAILANKKQSNTEEITDYIFPKDLFTKVIGQQEGIPIKPDPTSLNRLISTLGVSKDEVLYVGDSDSDMMVAQNAGVKKVGVTYGYRKKEEIEKYHPDYFIDDFEEIIQVIERIK